MMYEAKNFQVINFCFLVYLLDDEEEEADAGEEVDDEEEDA